jgi:NSS family neurotransmitter:Na+ symporter
MLLSGIVICLFVGWRLDKKMVEAEVTNGGAVPFRFFRFYLFLIRFVVPIVISAIFVNELLR